MGGDAARGTETISKEPENFSLAAKIEEPARKQNAGPEIADAWRAEILTPRKAPTVNPEQELKKAKESFGSLDSLAAKPGLKDGQGSQSKLESSRIQYALFADPKDRQQIKESLLSYYKSENKPLYEALKRLDTVESQLAKLGPKAAPELAELRRQQDAFYNPYGRIMDASIKQNIPVFFPKEGDADFLKGPYVYEILGSEKIKVYLKGRENPEKDMSTVAAFNRMIKEFPSLKDQYGAERIDLQRNKPMEIKMQFRQNDTNYELKLNADKPLSEQLAGVRSDFMNRLSKEYNLDFAAESSNVVIYGRPTNKTAAAPTIPQLLALEDGLSRSKTNFVVGDKPLKVVWTDLGVDGLFSNHDGRSAIFLSSKTSLEKRSGWDVSSATYVVMHELGHMATASLSDQLKKTSYVAAAFGWADEDGQKILKGADGSKYCFLGFKSNQQDPLSPLLDLDNWQKGCPTNGARFLSWILGRNDYPTVDRSQIGRVLPRQPFTNYYWNIEETAVEALTAYQAGGQSALNLAKSNPEAFERAAELDKTLISRHTSSRIDSPKLVRMPTNGRLESASPQKLLEIETWEKTNLKK